MDIYKPALSLEALKALPLEPEKIDVKPVRDKQNKTSKQ